MNKSKLPKTVYVSIQDEDSDDEFLLADREPEKHLCGEQTIIAGEYVLKNVVKISSKIEIKTN